MQGLLTGKWADKEKCAPLHRPCMHRHQWENGLGSEQAWAKRTVPLEVMIINATKNVLVDCIVFFVLANLVQVATTSCNLTDVPRMSKLLGSRMILPTWMPYEVNL